MSDKGNLKEKNTGFCITIFLLLLTLSSAAQGVELTLVELNCENLFDTQHDSLKNDYDFLPEGSYGWTRTRYWRKLNRIGQEIVACGEQPVADGDSVEVDRWSLPDLVALCEVENDTTMRDLTKRSLLRKARYEYVMTDSPDPRGIDVALLYSPFSFQLLDKKSVAVDTLPDMHPTRDILYVVGRIKTGDTLHVFVTHMPSRSGGGGLTESHRMQVVGRLKAVIDSIRGCSPDAHVIVAGDMNAYPKDKSMKALKAHGLHDVTENARGRNGAKGTYRYHGLWRSLDHVFVSSSLKDRVKETYVFDAPYLMEADEKYGGWKPRRNYLGPRYLNGFSDHLPLVVRLHWPEEGDAE